jgi:hypothetical protein
MQNSLDVLHCSPHVVQFYAITVHSNHLLPTTRFVGCITWEPMDYLTWTPSRTLPRRCNACGLPLVHLRGLSGHWMHAGTSMAECCALSAAAFAAATYKPSIELVRLLCQHFAHELRLHSSSLNRKLTCSFLENVALLYLRLGPHAHRQALTARALRTAANPESSTAVKEAIAVVLVEAQGPFKYYLRHPEFRNSQVRLFRILFSSKALHLPMPCNLCSCGLPGW